MARFVAHYERLTRWMQADVPGRADWVIRLGDDHRILAVLHSDSVQPVPPRVSPDGR